MTRTASVGKAPGVAIATMVPFWIPISRSPTSSGVTTRPPRMTRSSIVHLHKWDLEMYVVASLHTECTGAATGDFQHVFGRCCGVIRRAAPGSGTWQSIFLDVDETVVRIDKEHIEWDERVHHPEGARSHVRKDKKHPGIRGQRSTFHQAVLPGLRRVGDLGGETGDFFLRVAAGNPHLGAWQRRLRAEQQQETQAQKPMAEPVLMLHEMWSLCSRGVLVQTPPLLGQDGGTRAEWIRPSKTAVQNAIHQCAALAHGQTCVAQASHNGAEQIGRQVIWCPRAPCSGCDRDAWRRLRDLVWHGLYRGAEVIELGQMRFALA